MLKRFAFAATVWMLTTTLVHAQKLQEKEDVLTLVAPLNLVHPGDPGFTIAACRSRGSVRGSPSMIDRRLRP